MNAFAVTEIARVYRSELLSGIASVSITPRSHHVLAFILDGDMENKIGSSVCALSGKEVLYVPNGALDVSVSNVGCKYIAVEFQTSCAEFPLSGHRKAQVIPNGFLQDFTDLYEIWQNDGFNKYGKSFEILYRIINRIIDSMHIAEQGKKEYDRLAPAIAYINQHFLENSFSVQALANFCNCSRVHLDRLFKALYNTTAFMYVIHKRIEYAEVLLRDARFSISEIAMQCGWTDVYAFSHAFKRITGLSPSSWRQKN